jgi:hypothetical protein
MQQITQAYGSFQMQHQASLKDEPRLDQVLTTTGFAELIAKDRRTRISIICFDVEIVIYVSLNKFSSVIA